MNTESLAGKVALVTGGSRGIGAAIAKRLAREGASVAITYGSSKNKADEVVHAIESSGRKALAIEADAANADAVRSAVEQTVQKMLADAGVQPGQVDTVFFTGGSSGVLSLRERIGAVLPAARKVEGDLFGSIGAGLALDAMRKFG